MTSLQARLTMIINTSLEHRSKQQFGFKRARTSRNKGFVLPT